MILILLVTRLHCPLTSKKLGLCGKEFIDLFQMVLALRYLHKDKGIVHRDLTPNNIMLGENDRVTISKFVCLFCVLYRFQHYPCCIAAASASHALMAFTLLELYLLSKPLTFFLHNLY